MTVYTSRSASRLVDALDEVSNRARAAAGRRSAAGQSPTAQLALAADALLASETVRAAFALRPTADQRSLGSTTDLARAYDDMIELVAPPMREPGWHAIALAGAIVEGAARGLVD